MGRPRSDAIERLGEREPLGERGGVAAPNLAGGVVDEFAGRFLAEGVGERLEPRDVEALGAHHDVSLAAHVNAAALGLALELRE